MTDKKRSYRPPSAVVSNATNGANLSQVWKRGCTNAIVETVNKGESLSYTSVKLMKAYFSGHSNPDLSKQSDDGGPSAEVIEWLMWGGTAGKKWSEKLIPEEPLDKNFTASNQILKVDDSLGLVMGYAIISKQKGEEYYDLHGDHIPEESMLKAAVEFMSGDRIVGDMHREVEGGTVVFAWPMTAEIAKAFNIETDTTGLMIAIKPENQKTLEKFKSGEYNGFSIGGTRVIDEEVDDE